MDIRKLAELRPRLDDFLTADARRSAESVRNVLDRAEVEFPGMVNGRGSVLSVSERQNRRGAASS